MLAPCLLLLVACCVCACDFIATFLLSTLQSLLSCLLVEKFSFCFQVSALSYFQLLSALSSCIPLGKSALIFVASLWASLAPGCLLTCPKRTTQHSVLCVSSSPRHTQSPPLRVVLNERSTNCTCDRRAVSVSTLNLLSMPKYTSKYK